jgi:hypothetical protein
MINLRKSHITHEVLFSFLTTKQQKQKSSLEIILYQ